MGDRPGGKVTLRMEFRAYRAGFPPHASPRTDPMPAQPRTHDRLPDDRRLLRGGPRGRPHRLGPRPARLACGHAQAVQTVAAGPRAPRRPRHRGPARPHRGRRPGVARLARLADPGPAPAARPGRRAAAAQRERRRRKDRHRAAGPARRPHPRLRRALPRRRRLPLRSHRERRRHLGHPRLSRRTPPVGGHRDRLRDGLRHRSDHPLSGHPLGQRCAGRVGGGGPRPAGPSPVRTADRDRLDSWAGEPKWRFEF